MILHLILIFLLGLVSGSFFNSVIYRLEKKESLKGRSYCPFCKHSLSWQDLVPIVSFFILKGRCRYCKKRISWQYPAVELAVGLLFSFLFYVLWPSSAFIYCLIIFSLLLLIFVFDLKHFLIPSEFLYPAIVIALFYNFSLKAIITGCLSALFFLLIFLLSKGRWLGFGDVKLALFMGLFLGWPNILTALFSSFFTGAIIGIGLIFLKKKGWKSEVPFAPFLISGTFIAFFWGEKIIQWYFSLLGF